MAGYKEAKSICNLNPSACTCPRVIQLLYGTAPIISLNLDSFDNGERRPRSARDQHRLECACRNARERAGRVPDLRIFINATLLNLAGDWDAIGAMIGDFVLEF